MSDDLYLPIYIAVMEQMYPDSEFTAFRIGKVSRQSLIVSGGICYVNRALSNRNLQTMLGRKQPMES